MKSPGCAALTATLFGAAAACANREPVAGISTIAPAAAYSDQSFTMTIRGSNFRPAYRVETGAGTAVATAGGFAVSLQAAPDGGTAAARIAAGNVIWMDTMTLSAQLPAQIAGGVYDVAVRDPRGNLVVLPEAFTSLGPDMDAPNVRFVAPAQDDVIGAGTQPEVSIVADDGLGTVVSLTWTVSGPEGTIASSCDLSPMPGATTCVSHFQAPIPTGGPETLTISATATDDAGNTGMNQVSVQVAPRPSIASADPRSGPTGGGTPLTIQGSNFVPSATIVLASQPLKTTVTGTTTLSATTQPHDPGPVPLAVRTGGGDVDAGSFLFVSQPIVRAVFPPQGPPAGGAPVSVVGDGFRAATTITFGDAPLRCPRFVNANRIDGFLPAGTGVVLVGAQDPVGGNSDANLYFAYQDAPDGGPGPPGDGGCGP